MVKLDYNNENIEKKKYLKTMWNNQFVKEKIAFYN